MGWEADQAVATCILDGDANALGGLVDRLHRSLVRLAELFVGRGGLAEDVVQDTWVVVIEGLHKYEGRSSLRTWIGNILTNRAKTRFGRECRNVPLDPGPCVAGEEVDAARFNALGFWSEAPITGADQALINAEVARWLREEVDQLPEAQRTVVTLRDLDGWSAEEVCNVLSVSETNQRVLLHRGRSRLRTALERRLLEERTP